MKLQLPKPDGAEVKPADAKAAAAAALDQPDAAQIMRHGKGDLQVLLSAAHHQQLLRPQLIAMLGLAWHALASQLYSHEQVSIASGAPHRPLC